MKTIMKTIQSLTSSIFAIDEVRLSFIFNHIYHMSYDIFRATIIPPTKIELINELNQYHNYYPFIATGETLHECKQSLREVYFPTYCLSSNMTTIDIQKKVKTVTWARMILAFNMYAELRKTFMARPYNYIDFIGSKRDELQTDWTPRLNNLCFLHIKDSQLNCMIELTELSCSNEYEDSEALFWDCIFDIYENLHYDSRFITTRVSSTNSVYVEQEYMNRSEDKLNIIIDNNKIASMIMKLECDLPFELKKTIYETCAAGNI